MSEMVDHVARALHYDHCQRGARSFPSDDDIAQTWARAEDRYREDFRVQARVAIAAMRTPNHHMLMAARDAFCRVQAGRATESEMLSAWLAAINKALEA